jgi:acetyl esterase/lipase
MRMATVRPAPPFDPECGATWRTISETMFQGRGPRIDAGSLADTRAFELSNLDALLEGRAYSHRELQLAGPAGDLTLSVFTPDDLTGTAPGVYWVHGGGMVAGSRFGAAEAMNAGTAVGAVVTSIEYRLAPEHPAPAPADDCYASLLWVAEHGGELGIDPTRIVLGGSSAGGGLAAATALRVRDSGGPALAGLLLCCPMLDDRMTSCSSDQFDDALLWTRASNEFGWRSLLGDRFGTDDRHHLRRARTGHRPLRSASHARRRRQRRPVPGRGRGLRVEDLGVRWRLRAPRLGRRLPRLRADRPDRHPVARRRRVPAPVDGPHARQGRALIRSLVLGRPMRSPEYQRTVAGQRGVSPRAS